jgi:hypothetical protein|tara:strand:+ start:419 stop:1036 length:618 start_codon:yes stop_codon:yes gene_type:complete
MSQRKLEYLIQRRIIYRRSPVNDIPTEVYDWGEYYADGTYECYELFKSKAKITSYKSLKWHVLVLRYLNPNIKDVELKNISRHITNIKNNFITFKPSDRSLDSIIQDVLSQSIEDPPRNKRRKIIFKEFSQLTLDEKLKIVGQMVGRSKRITEEDIYEMMIEINDNGKKITINEIADKLSCSARTIHRTMGDDLKREKDVLNLTL